MVKTRVPRRPPDQADDGGSDSLHRLKSMTIHEMRSHWFEINGKRPSTSLSRDILLRALCHHAQEQTHGGPDKEIQKLLHAHGQSGTKKIQPIKPGSVIMREHQGKVHEVVVVPDGYLWQGETYKSLSAIARTITGVHWNGLKFFGLGAYKRKRPFQ